MKTTNEKLSKDLVTSKQKVNENDRERSRTQSTDSGGTPMKGGKVWDELAKKDQKIEELEKMLKEKSKLIATLKKNQTIDREKQLLSVNESKKNEEDINAQITQLKVCSTHSRHN